MDFTMEERSLNIIKDCMNSEETNPVSLFHELAAKDYVRIHGPEHHILDGACVMTAFFNAGGECGFKKRP